MQQPHETETPEKILLEAAKNHAEKMRVAADDNLAKCVDGGYKENEAVGALAIPGGHLGIAMNLLALGYSPQESFDMTYNFLNDLGITFGWHTDNHEGHGETIVGCGHCNAAIKRGEEYGVDGEAVAELLDLIRTEQQRGEKKMECVVLNRDHAEKAILVVRSTDFTVKPWDEEADIQYFIYDQARHMLLLDELAEVYDLDREQLQAVVEQQINATLGLLGSSRGKPMIAVDVSDGDAAVVAMLGYAPVIE